MPTLTRGQRGSKLPAGLLGMLILLAVTENYVAKHGLDYTRTDYWDWKWTGTSAKSRVRDCQVLCFGTSRIQQAIVPHVIEHQSGLKTWNLGLCWGQAPAAYFLLRRALEAGATPSAILVEYHPVALSEDHRGAKGFWPELLNFRETLDLAWSARDASFLASTTLAHNLPSIQDREQIRSGIMAPITGKKASPWASTLTSMRNRNINRGAFIMPSIDGFRARAARIYEGAFLGQNWTCSPLNASYIRRLLTLASANGIQVYWILPPFAPELQGKRERTGNVASYEAFVRDWMADFPNLTVLDAENSQYASEVFYDPVHLDRTGALALSASVGDLLRAGQTTTPDERWVRLPAYREWIPSFRVEDIPMSQAYLMEIGKIRR